MTRLEELVNERKRIDAEINRIKNRTIIKEHVKCEYLEGKHFNVHDREWSEEQLFHVSIHNVNGRFFETLRAADKSEVIDGIESLVRDLRELADELKLVD